MIRDTQTNVTTDARTTHEQRNSVREVGRFIVRRVAICDDLGKFFFRKEVTPQFRGHSLGKSADGLVTSFIFARSRVYLGGTHGGVGLGM
jgi:hypothetical protein